MADLASLDLVDHRRGRLHQGVASKADGDEMLELNVLEAFQRLGLGDNGREVLSFQMGHPGQPTMERVKMRSE